MENKPQHTPLPWHVDVMGYLRGPNNENILEVKENAEFIVSAVHSHEALLKAAKFASSVLGNIPAFGDNIGDKVNKAVIGSVLHKLSLVIAQSEGK